MQFVLLAAVLLLLYTISVALYRLYLSPLAKFPGPKLAALTSWYNAYYDLWEGGQYVWAIEEMHHKYGPIVRTRPDTLHVNDPNFIETLYTQSPKRRRERFYTFTQTNSATGSMLVTADHDLHRKRRTPLNPFFSQRNVQALEPVILSTLMDLLGRMDGWARAGSVIATKFMFRAATKDIIQAYALGGGQKFLEMEDCNAAFFEAMEPNRICHIGTHIPILLRILESIPESVMAHLVPRLEAFIGFNKGIQAQIEDIRRSKEYPEGKTIFHDIMRSDMPESEKSVKRLTEEAIVVIFAGADTTAQTLSSITYHLLSDTQLISRLKAELETIMPDRNQLPDTTKLDGLPLLNAIIDETLRLHPSTSNRQDRMAPDEDLVYERPDGKVFKIPAGTGVGMTAPILNRHPGIYDNPEEFNPDRYIENPKLRKYLLTFSKGSRQCIGMNLAYKEMQCLVAGIFRKYDLYDPTKKVQNGPTLELYKTTEEDITMAADYITPVPYAGSPGVRLLIRQ